MTEHTDAVRARYAAAAGQLAGVPVEQAELSCGTPVADVELRAGDVVLLGLVLPLGEILGRSTASFERRRTGALVVGLYVGLVAANFVWLWPILNGDAVSMSRWSAEMWLPTWH